MWGLNSDAHHSAMGRPTSCMSRVQVSQEHDDNTDPLFMFIRTKKKKKKSSSSKLTEIYPSILKCVEMSELNIVYINNNLNKYQNNDS